MQSVACTEAFRTTDKNNWTDGHLVDVHNISYFLSNPHAGKEKEAEQYQGTAYNI